MRNKEAKEWSIPEASRKEVEGEEGEDVEKRSDDRVAMRKWVRVRKGQRAARRTAPIPRASELNESSSGQA